MGWKIRKYRNSLILLLSRNFTNFAIVNTPEVNQNTPTCKNKHRQKNVKLKELDQCLMFLIFCRFYYSKHIASITQDWNKKNHKHNEGNPKKHYGHQKCKIFSTIFWYIHIKIFWYGSMLTNKYCKTRRFFDICKVLTSCAGLAQWNVVWRCYIGRLLFQSLLGAWLG